LARDARIVRWPSDAMTASLLITGGLFIVAGVLHFVAPRPYVAIMPAYLPSPLALVYLSGVGEILGGLGLLVLQTRTLAALGLIMLLIAVLPANVEMLRQVQARGTSTVAIVACWLRLPLQLVLMWWVWRVAQSGRDLVQ
jgi:uncharacterized membrane protein